MELKLPDSEKKVVGEIVKLIKEKDNFLITTHTSLDGDAISSELILYSLLKDLKKKVMIINEDSVPSVYKFLPFTERIKKISEIKKRKKFEVVFILDCGNLPRIGKAEEFIPEGAIIVNIDHHFSNKVYGDINWISPSYSSCGEMLFYLVSEFGDISKQQAMLIYTAILTDTGGFMHHFGKNTFSIISRLMEKGIEPSEIAKKVYLEKPLRSIKLFILALGTFKYDRKTGACWMKVTKHMFRKTNTTEEDTEGFVDFLKTVKESRISFLIKEKKDGVKVSFRSKGDVNVDEIARIFGGGGHREASGCFIKNITPEKAEREVLKLIKSIC